MRHTSQRFSPSAWTAVHNSSVCCRSPIIPARPTFSATDMLIAGGASTDGESTITTQQQDSNIWTNPMDGGGSSSHGLDRASYATGAATATAVTMEATARARMAALTVPATAADSRDGRVSANENRIPDTIQRELDQRRIGNRCAIHDDCYNLTERELYKLYVVW